MLVSGSESRYRALDQSKHDKSDKLLTQTPPLVNTKFIFQNTTTQLVLLSSLGEEIRPLLEGRVGELGFGPEFGRQETVGLGDGFKGGLDKVAEGTCATLGGGVAITDTSEFEQLLGDRGGNEAGTTGSRNETGHDGTTLSGNLGGDGVRLTENGTPVTSADRDDRELGKDDSTTDELDNAL